MEGLEFYSKDIFFILIVGMREDGCNFSENCRFGGEIRGRVCLIVFIFLRNYKVRFVGGSVSIWGILGSLRGRRR